MGIFRRRKHWQTPSAPYYTVYKDMLQQPHLLIAGATGSGKSVVINALMYTALCGFPFDTPNGNQFILIDPKRVELSMYARLPHTIAYASEPEQFEPVLRHALSICDNRYRAMQKAGVRKYGGSNVYIVIDEFADLMTTQKRKIMPLIQRIAQIGRAAKVHIILATQTPIARVLPTEIKCNFDARVGLRTRSAQDSRNILGVTGCEMLPRYGEGYYMTPEGITRYKLPMHSDEDLNRQINHWMNQTKKELFPRTHYYKQ